MRGRLNAAWKGSDDGGCELVLDRENIGKLAVIAIGPDVPVGARIDELDGDAHPVAGLAHAAFDDILDAEPWATSWTFTALPLYTKVELREMTRRSWKRGQCGDDVLGQTVGEELLFGIPAHIDEGQHGDRRLLIVPPSRRSSR